MIYKYQAAMQMEIISLTKDVSIAFIHATDGHRVNSFTVEQHRTEYIGKLKSFNRLKCLKQWKKNNGDLVKAFIKILNKKDWDFVQWPNPDAYLLQKIK